MLKYSNFILENYSEVITQISDELNDILKYTHIKQLSKQGITRYARLLNEISLNKQVHLEIYYGSGITKDFKSRIEFDEIFDIYLNDYKYVIQDYKTGNKTIILCFDYKDIKNLNLLNKSIKKVKKFNL